MTTKLSKNFPKIRIFADLSYGTGYNNATRGLVQALAELGLESDHVHAVGAVTASGYQEAFDHDWFAQYVYSPWAGDDKINIVHLNPGMVGDYYTPFGRRYNIAYCSWETDSLPKAVFNVNGQERTVVGDLNKFDEIWVPSPYNKQVFTNSGVEKPIFVIPHALQNELLKRPIKIGSSNDRRVLYFIGSWNARKNPEALLRAYFATGWNKTIDVQLLLHCIPSTRELSTMEAASWLTQESVKNLYNALPNKDTAPQFGILTTPRSYAAILDLHERGDIFITMTRGEGFCLPVVEALALGNPVIAPNAHSIKDVANCLATPSTMLQLVDAVTIPITPMPECRGYELDQTWHEANAAQFTKTLMDSLNVLADPSLAAARRSVGEATRAAYSPSAVAAQLLPRLEYAERVLAKSGW